MADTCISYNPIGFVRSDWVFGWLPIRYKASTTKWPVNNFDPVATIASITNDNGFAKVSLSGDTFLALEYVKINSTDYPQYVGIWQVRAINDDGTITISASYLADDTGGTIQRYYQNYSIKAKVFVGIPGGHTKNAIRPIEEKDILAYRPDKSNEVEIDISSYIRADFGGIQNKLCEVLGGLGMGNDTHLWTAFYIALAESYDTVVGGQITTFTSEYVSDTILNESVEEITYSYAMNATQNFQYFQGRSMGEYVLADIVGNAKIKFLTHFDKPTYFYGYEHDIAIGNGFNNDDFPANTELRYRIVQKDSAGNSLFINNGQVPTQDEGLYRISLENFNLNVSTSECDIKFLLFNTSTSEETDLTEVKTVIVKRNIRTSRGIFLRWFNTLGAWESWYFEGLMDHDLRVFNRQTIEKDIFSNFDTYFVNGDSQREHISTKAVEKRTVRSLFLNKDELEAISGILYSNKVYEVVLDGQNDCGRYKYRTIIIDPNTYNMVQGRNRLFQISFRFEYSDYIQIQGQ